MISGIVSANRQAILPMTILSQSKDVLLINAVVDTGFDDWLILPPDFIAKAAMRPGGTGRAVLADGRESVFNIYYADVLWDGKVRKITVSAMDASPLVGMSMLYGYEIVLPVLDGATFTITSIQ